jgi:putative colanic acid biosynthesis UDP-glucose lipid carrier transferase
MARRGILREYASVFDVFHRALDIFAILIAAYLAYWITAGHLEVATRYHEAVFLALVLSFVIFRWFTIYHSWRGIRLLTEIQQVTVAWAVVFLVLTMLAFLLKIGHHYSREWALAWWGLGWVLLVTYRSAVRIGLRWLRYEGANQRRIVIVGATDLASYTIRQIRRVPWTGLRIVGLFDEEPNVPRVGVFSGVPVWGGLKDVARYVELGNIDQVWLCLPLRAEEQVRGVLEDLKDSTVNIRFIPDIFGFNLMNHSMTEVAGIPIIDLSASPMQGLNSIIKAIEDRLLAVMILLLISPLIAAIALAVKLTSPGPVFYRQERIGWNGRPFEMLKFRSMSSDCEHNGVTWGGAQSKSVTSIGRFLRRTSLDELPQFLNVLRGEMSIVGPRPERPMFVKQFKDEIPGYMKKHMVKAGITGWAQVNGWRGDTDLQKRIEYDLYYIENWSLWLDLKIIALTLFKGFAHRNAN